VSAVGFVAARELRRRWLRVLVLTLFVGVIGMCTLAAAAGARRSSTALARFKAVSRSADIELQAAPTPGQLEQLSRVRGVAALGMLRAYGIVIPAAPDFQSIGAPIDSQFGDVVDRDRIIAGRALSPNAADEVTIGEGFAARLGLQVGDVVVAESYSPKQVAAILGGASDVGPRQGPTLQLRVVGIVRRPLDLGEQGAAGGLMVLSPAFDRKYSERIGIFGARIRILTEHGAADAPHVLGEARRILGDSGFASQSLAIESQGARNAIGVLTLALWIAAAVAALAGALAIGIVLTREISSMTVDQDTLRDLGCIRVERMAVALPPTLLIAASGAIVAVVGAVAVSPRFPLGVARRADPSIGVHVDAVVMIVGIGAVLTVVLSVAFLAAYRATGRLRGDRARLRPTRTSALGARVAATGVAPTMSNGVRMAIDPGRGRAAVPVRSAFFGAILGIVGVTAALVFASSLDHLTTTPRAYGESWQFKVMDVTPNTPCDGPDYGVARLPGVAALAEVCTQNVEIEGRPTAGLAYTQLGGGEIGPQIIEGRAPIGAHEVALGAKTMHDLGVHIGDPVKVAGRRAHGEYQVVGRAVFPTLGPAQQLGDGAALTGAGFAPLFDQNIFFRFLVGRFAAGTNRNELRQRIDAVPQLSSPTASTLPAEIDRLHQVDWLPISLAILLGSLALFAVGHAIVVSVHRRRRELALLKTLGFEVRQVRATVGWQATTIGGVGVVVGVPGGVIVGEYAWRRVAEGLGIATHLAVPALGLAVIAAGALAVVNMVAFVPARAAARTRPSVALHSE
jgi:ABC-type lipoprotein release transport system permease subunit